MYGQGLRPPQFKFNNLLNEHFPKLIYFAKVFCNVKTGKVEVNIAPIEKWYSKWLRL